jgi:hypothetical protein
MSLPSSSKGSRLSGIIPLPIWKGGMGLNLNRIDRGNIAHPRITSLYRKESKGKKGENEIAQLMIKKLATSYTQLPSIRVHRSRTMAVTMGQLRERNRMPILLP